MYPSPSRHQAVVLVVDDDADIRDALRDVLEQAGYSVAEAANGELALTYLERHPPPAAILLDLFMPVMDGWELARRLAAAPALAPVPILVVTASGPHWGYPGARVFRKPLNLTQLLHAVDDVVTRRDTAQ
jgi:CheY-like chemotaxis protein